MTLKEDLAAVEAELKRLEARKRELYDLSIKAPAHEKLCMDSIAEMLAEPFGELELPIEVTGLHFTGKTIRENGYPKRSLVRIRPCGAEFEQRTFLGLYLGDVATTMGCSFNRETGVLELFLAHHNPAIWIPSRQRIVFGYESWWGPIESAEQLRAITNESIDGLWYVQALKALSSNGEKDVQG